jgi:hypothetical protein
VDVKAKREEGLFSVVSYAGGREMTVPIPYTACARYQRAIRTVTQWDLWLGAARKCNGYAEYTGKT